MTRRVVVSVRRAHDFSSWTDMRHTWITTLLSTLRKTILFSFASRRTALTSCNHSTSDYFPHSSDTTATHSRIGTCQLVKASTAAPLYRSTGPPATKHTREKISSLPSLQLASFRSTTGL